MSTYRDLVYLVSDLVKTISDDTIINESHISFLLGKYRSYLLKQKYEKELESNIPSSNYQTICADLIEVPMAPDGMCTGTDGCVVSLHQETLLRTKNKIPDNMNIGSIKATGAHIFSDLITIIDKERFSFVGYNRWLQNIVYGTIADDKYLYLKSGNPDFLNLKKIHINAIFEDPLEASEQQYCEDEKGEGGCPLAPACDEMDREFPIEEALQTQLIALVIKDILGAAWRPKDSVNNANDDLADIANFVRRYTKKDFRDVIEQND